MTSNTLWFIYNFNISLIQHLKQGYKIIIVAPIDEYQDLLVNYVDEIIDIKINSSGTSPVEDSWLTYQYYKIFKEVKPDIILSYTIKPNIYGNLAAARLGIPVINTITGLGTIFIKENFATKIGEVLYRGSFKYSSHTFFLNQADKGTFLERDLTSPDLVSIVPGSGIDTTHFKTDRKQNKGKVFLFVGRLLGDKGIRELIEAFKIVIQEYPNIELRIAGELGSNNKTAVKESELSEWLLIPQINYLGKTDDIISEMEKADVMILPSYREGLSRSLLEAASMGMPIISSNVPGCIEVVRDNENGFLCKPRNSADLAMKIKKMMHISEEVRLSMGKKGRKIVEEEFDQKIVNELYGGRIDQILN